MSRGRKLLVSMALFLTGACIAVSSGNAQDEPRQLPVSGRSDTSPASSSFYVLANTNVIVRAYAISERVDSGSWLKVILKVDNTDCSEAIRQPVSPWHGGQEVVAVCALGAYPNHVYNIVAEASHSEGATPPKVVVDAREASGYEGVAVARESVSIGIWPNRSGALRVSGYVLGENGRGGNYSAKIQFDGSDRPCVGPLTRSGSGGQEILPSSEFSCSRSVQSGSRAKVTLSTTPENGSYIRSVRLHVSF